MTEIAILNFVANRESIYIRYQAKLLLLSIFIGNNLLSSFQSHNYRAFEIETVVLAITELL